MQWNKVKTVLIILLLCADIFLGAMALSRLISYRASEREALDEAWSIAQSKGVRGNGDMFFDMPARLYVWNNTRDAAREEGIARALCGADMQKSVTGKDIYQFDGDGARAVFRSGGYFELYLDADRPADAQSYFSSLLKRAGVPFSGARWQQEEGLSGRFTMSFKGAPVSGAYLQCRWQDGRAAVEGRWWFTEPVRAGAAPSRAERVLKLADGEPKNLSGRCELRYVFNGSGLYPVWEVGLISAEGETLLTLD